MGCDIHIVIQVQADGVWREQPWQYLYPHQKAEGVPLVPGIPEAPDGFDSRNYDLFGILADVRNGVGFAGIETGTGWRSIAAERGFPDDFDDEVVLNNPNYPDEGSRYLGEHSFTWVTLDELKAYPWDVEHALKYGCVPAANYRRLNGCPPASYCGDIAGPGITVYTPEEYDRAKQAGTLAKEPYIRARWVETARSATNDWPGYVLPWLDQIAAGRPLRLILGFDS